MTDFQLFITVFVTTLGLAFLATGLAIWIDLIIKRGCNRAYVKWMKEAQD